MNINEYALIIIFALTLELGFLWYFNMLRISRVKTLYSVGRCKLGAHYCLLRRKEDNKPRIYFTDTRDEKEYLVTKIVEKTIHTLYYSEYYVLESNDLLGKHILRPNDGKKR